ncbi:MAG: mechanosensitive ion channel family protein [Candidatus Nanoarchaeia archaeon]
MTFAGWIPEDYMILRIILSILFVIACTILAANTLSWFLRKVLVKPIAIARGKVIYTIHDKTRYRVVSRLIIALIYATGLAIIVAMIPELKVFSLSLLAGAGVLAAVIGFAAQKTTSNIVAGISIAIFEPFRVGDKLMISGNYGTVHDITLAHTVVQTWDNRSLIIPNSKITEDLLENYTYDSPKIMKHLDMSISYDSDVDKAKAIMVDEAIHNPKFHHVEEEFELVSKSDLVSVRMTDLTDFAAVLRLYFWAPNPLTGFKMQCELRESIKKRFKKESIEIPYPYRTILYKKDMRRKIPQKKK